MTPLSDHFTPGMCKTLLKKFNITTVEEAQRMNQRLLRVVRGVGKAFMERLWSIRTDVNPDPNVTVKVVKTVRDTRLVIDGLSPLQRNAILNGFLSGKLQNFLNTEYFTESMRPLGFNDNEPHHIQVHAHSPLYIRFK